jgi:hypothetical protein
VFAAHACSGNLPFLLLEGGKWEIRGERMSKMCFVLVSAKFCSCFCLCGDNALPFSRGESVFFESFIVYDIGLFWAECFLKSDCLYF